MRFLLFTLYAPMGSFGEIAVGERRMGWARPGRSAVLGLVAAAMGIERTDDEAHRNLEEGLYYAVKTEATGRPFIDYHTAQTPRSSKAALFATRRDELTAGELSTVLSVREWRSDAFFTVVLWPRAAGATDLDGIASALSNPRFSLYLGRKAAPLGLPLNPAILEADTFMDALAKRNPNAEEGSILKLITGGASAPPEVAFDADAPDAPAETRVERRRDAIASRARWQFGDRAEKITVPGGSES